MSLVSAHGASPEDILFAYPHKQISHIEYAKATGIQKMVFDCKEELYKIKEYYPAAQWVLDVAGAVVYHWKQIYASFSLIIGSSRSMTSYSNCES